MFAWKEYQIISVINAYCCQDQISEDVSWQSLELHEWPILCVLFPHGSIAQFPCPDPQQLQQVKWITLCHTLWQWMRNLQKMELLRTNTFPLVFTSLCISKNWLPSNPTLTSNSGYTVCISTLVHKQFFKFRNLHRRSFSTQQSTRL